jgi:hypothetical protein
MEVMKLLKDGISDNSMKGFTRQITNLFLSLYKPVFIVHQNGLKSRFSQSFRWMSPTSNSDQKL